jgi:hypothetical protein
MKIIAAKHIIPGTLAIKKADFVASTAVGFNSNASVVKS